MAGFDGLGTFLVVLLIVGVLLGIGATKGCEAISHHIGRPTIGWTE